MQRAYDKEVKRLYGESRELEAVRLNEQIERTVEQMSSLLSDALVTNRKIDLDSLKQASEIGAFDPGGLGYPESPPQTQGYFPKQPSLLQSLIPGTKERFARDTAYAHQRVQSELTAHSEREARREAELARLWSAYQNRVQQMQTAIAEQHQQIEDLKRAIASGERTAVTKYFSMVVEGSNYPSDFPTDTAVAYVPESKQIVVERDLPTFDIVPEIGTYKYVKTRDAIATTSRPVAQRRALYSSIIAQMALRTLYEIFTTDYWKIVDTVVFSGFTTAIDKATGHLSRVCLISVRVTRTSFEQLNLRQVDPAACLRSLSAAVSKSPAELAPVRPILEFNMVDPRFIDEIDVLTNLDHRPNLMELTPSEFEALISNLFEKMGLETRVTQASRDGGVDCVAYDPRPIFGGKVIIQAKRYKHTVGVSAVRDLFGTLQNEGASKGILVTTSGYGKAAFDFAKGKPLELLDGSNLLYLLAEHAGIEAKIQAPETWQDPIPDSAM